MAAERSSRHRKVSKALNQLSEDELAKELKKAIDVDNVDKARQILDLGVDPNGSYISFTMGYKTNEPFITSIRSGRMLELFMERGGNIDLPDLNGYTLLIHAVQAENIELVKACLHNGADANYITGVTRFSVLRLAAMIRMSEQTPNNIVTIFRLLLEAGADPNEDRSYLQYNDEKRGDFDTDPLLFLIINRKYNERHPENALPILKLFDEHKADFTIINPITQYNLLQTVLLSTRPNIGIVQFLLENNRIDIDSQSDKNGYTALHLAVQYNHSEIVNLLIEEGASVNLQTKDGATPLLIACHSAGQNRTRDAIVNSLLGAKSNNRSISNQNRRTNKSNRADVNIENKDGFTPLLSASKFGLANIVERLIENGADVNHRIQGGETSLFFAVSGGHSTVVHILLEHGADPNLSSYGRGITPLHLAIMQGQEPIVRDLLKHGADPLQTTSNPPGGTTKMITRLSARRNPQFPQSIAPLVENARRNRLNAARHVTLRLGNERGRNISGTQGTQRQYVSRNLMRHITGFLNKNTDPTLKKHNKKSGGKYRRTHSRSRHS